MNIQMLQKHFKKKESRIIIKLLRCVTLPASTKIIRSALYR